MKSRLENISSLVLSVILALCVLPISVGLSADRPNIIFIMADDLGYGDLGCYGQKLISTPRLDQMAREGMKFNQFYAGCTVCASSRSVLMTGQHMGHTHVRGNASNDMSIQSLRDKDITVAEVLKKAGYATALCGKWGLGDDYDGARQGIPTRQGFDFFYGYLNQVHAHNYYPEFLWRNTEKHKLRNVVTANGRGYGGFKGGYATKRVDYSHDLIAGEAMKWTQQQIAAYKKDGKPFFLYLSLTIPHANNEGTRGTGDGQEVPEYGIYKDKPWKKQSKGQAAMITRMDRDIGKLLDLLKREAVDKNTLVMFTSDNGPHNEGGHNVKRFQPAGPLRGMKRDLYEGGIRVPLIARWPETIPAQSESNHIGYFGDLMATVAELAGTKMPENCDSISFVPELKKQDQTPHKYLYWEFYERGGKQAVRAGKWKAIRIPMFSGKTELYELNSDIGETDNVAQKYPEVVKRLEAMMDEAHVAHPNWKVRGRRK